MNNSLTYKIKIYINIRTINSFILIILVIRKIMKSFGFIKKLLIVLPNTANIYQKLF